MQKIKPLLFLATLLVIAVLTTMAGRNAGWFKKDLPAEQPPARTEFERLCTRYLQQDTLLSLAGNIALWDGEDRKQVKEQSSFELARQGKKMYTRLSYLQTFCNDQLMVQLDTVNRVMVVAEAMKNTSTEKTSLQQSVDLLFSDTAAFKLTGQVSGNNQLRTLTFKSDFNPGIRIYRVTYDAQTYQLKKATIEWWKDAMVLDSTQTDKVWITNIDYRYLPATGVNVDGMINDMITRQGEEIKLTEKYKDYQLHVAF